jgi:peptide/nickel transport system substrate-binding protein
VRATSRGSKLLVLLLSFVLFATVACGGDDDTSEEGKGAEDTVPEADVPSGGQITYASDQEPTGWNPQTANDALSALAYLGTQVYPQAFITMPDFSVVPDENLLVSAEQTSDDPQTIEFKLNPDAIWSDDVPITADDFIYNWKMQNGKVDADLGESDPEAPTPDDTTIPDVASTTGYELVESMEATSDDGKTFEMVFAEPYADWQSLFVNIMPAHILKDVKGWNESMDGEKIPEWSGGPFKFEDYKPEQSVNMVPNEKYWGDKPKLDRLVIRFGLDAPALPQALENNEIDMAYPQPQTDLLDELSQVQGVKTQVNFGLSFEHIDFNLLNPLLADQAVREAIAYGLDREDLLERTVKQFDDRAELLNNRIWMTNQEEYEAHGEQWGYDPDKATKGLEDAGYVKGADGIYANKDGKRLSFRISTTSGNKLREDTQQVILDQLKKVGIEITIENAEGSAVFDKFFPESGNFADADYDIALFAYVQTPFISGSVGLYTTDSGQNEMSYSNPKVDELLQAAAKSTDRDEVVELSNQADEEMWKDLPTIPLYQKPTLLPYRDTLVNVIDNASTFGPLWNAYALGVTKN